MIETKRLILRPWQISDAFNLYEYASDPRIGLPAGFPAHTSVEDSLNIIQTVLAADETYAVVLKEEGKVVGSVGLMIGERSNLTKNDKEGEIGYWIGVPYWGMGLIPEAVKALMNYAFYELKMETLWCGYYLGNEKSKKVQEKCGFHFHHVIKNQEVRLLNEVRDEYVTSITQEEWNQLK